jgi:hypothetical protein
MYEFEILKQLHSDLKKSDDSDTKHTACGSEVAHKRVTDEWQHHKEEGNKVNLELGWKNADTPLQQVSFNSTPGILWTSHHK